MKTNSSPVLTDLVNCFQGIVPSIIATSDSQGIPNVTYVSQVHLVDDSHVALSRQFFNKTSRNLDQNPLTCAEIYDPVTFEAYRLRLRFLRTEASGELFETMRLRIDAIASHTGMSGVFRLIGADVFEVLSVERVEGFLSAVPVTQSPKVSASGYPSEMRGLQLISEKINLAEDLASLLSDVLEALEQFFGFEHTMVLLFDETSNRLTAVESRGYGGSGAGAEVPLGEGLIGTVALEQRLLRITGIDAGFRYGRAVRREFMQSSETPLRPEIPLPGLPDAQSALVIPLSVKRRLIGVLAAESRDSSRFFAWHEAYLEIIGNQIALGIDRMLETLPPENESSEQLPSVSAPGPRLMARDTDAPRKTLMYYASDDSIFVDGEYLIRNVPGKILWKLLRQWEREGRTEFTNRELRLDTSLGLPTVKDNLESRLILLRRRLEEKCPELRMEPCGRGRFALRIDARLEMVER
jgi:adenylate cyclase